MVVAPGPQGRLIGIPPNPGLRGSSELFLHLRGTRLGFERLPDPAATNQFHTNVTRKPHRASQRLRLRNVDRGAVYCIFLQHAREMRDKEWAGRGRTYNDKTMNSTNGTKSRGTTIKLPDATPGILVVNGQQRPFTLERVWSKHLNAAPLAFFVTGSEAVCMNVRNAFHELVKTMFPIRSRGTRESLC